MNRATVLRPHGYSVSTGDGRDAEADYLSCCHCGAHFAVSPGSGKRRGWCGNCAAVTCGAHKCDPCVHWKKKIELIEGGHDRGRLWSGDVDGLPVTANVPAAVPKSPGGVILGKG